MLALDMRARGKAFVWAIGLWSLTALAGAQTIVDGVAAQVAADAPDEATMSVAPPPVITAPGDAARERAWRFGLALGYGRRTNPLIQSDDIPVIVDVDIAWFGKRWFFDNGDVGFALLDRPAFTTNLVARINSDRVFFGKTNTRYVNFAYQGSATPPTALVDSSGLVVPPPVAVAPPDRDYAIETGFETLFDGVWGAATLRAFHDVSGTHRGYEVAADYQYRVTRGRLSFTPSLGVAYKSARLSDYYWGVHAGEANPGLPAYRARAGVGWEAGLRANYYVTKRLRFALAANYEHLQHSVAESPLAASDHVFGYFSGLAWTF